MQTLLEATCTRTDCLPRIPRSLDTLVDITAWRAREQPNDPAYIFLSDGEQLEQRLSYAEFDRRVRRLASALGARGLRGQRVLLVMNPGLDYNTAIFACMYAGAVAVPIYPPDPFRAHRMLPRLQAVVRDAEAALVLCQEEILEWAGAMIESTCGTTTLAIERASAGGTLDWEPPMPDPDGVALLQYTSGSTGSPKGVVLTHRNLMHNLASLHRLDKPGAVIVSWLPPYHDMGLIGCVLAPIHSGRLGVLMSPLAFVQRPVRWLSAISRYRASTSAAPNFGYDLCLRKIRPAECEGLDLSCWCVAVNGAEPVQAETLERFTERFGPYGFRRETFCPAFGMAESTLLVASGYRGDGPLVVGLSAQSLEQGRVEEVDPSDAGARRLVGCGQPVPQGEVAIVDPQTCVPAPAEAVGEVWVRSPSVARGYWNRPEETEQLFHARLAGHTSGDYLRTGDLGFICRGQLFVAGRVKELIILGGRNYYPHDVERTAQRAHPALKPDGGAAFSIECDGAERLVVVQELLRPKSHDLQAILRDIRRELTEEYEWPPYAVVLIPAGSLPKTSSGKTRRTACREMFLRGELPAAAEWRAESGPDAESASGSAADPLQTPMEHKLASLWCDVLGIEPKGRSDDFFSFGGQSLRASQLAVRLRDEFGVDFPLTVLFERPTIGQQARWIERAIAGRGEAAAPLQDGIPPRSVERPPVLSCTEERLWFFDQLQPQHPFYNMPAAVRVRGPLEAGILQRALDELARRHEILRTTFPSEQGRPTRRIAAAVEIPFRLVDLERMPEYEREAELERRLRSEAAQPFDLANGPLLRCLVYRLHEREHVVLLAMHHIISDGWSMGLLLGELSRLYSSLASRGDGRDAIPQRGGLQYSDFAAWQQDRATTGGFEEQLAYWERQLGTARSDAAGRAENAATPVPPLELPTDRPRSANQGFAGALRPMDVGPATLAAVDALARREGTTRFVVLMAAYKAVLSRYSRQEDIAVGTIVANRTHRELEDVLGFFANTVVLRTDLSGDPTFRELVARVHRVTFEAHAHQEVPFGKVVERLKPERCGNRPPLFQTALVLENMPLDLPAGTPWQIERLAIDNGTSKYDLALLLWEEGDRLRGDVEYSTALFDAGTIDGIIAALGTLLDAAAAEPEQRISQLPLVDASLRQRIVSEFNAPQAPEPSQCLHHLFEEHAARSPERIALVVGKRRLTYGELDRRATRLAAHLQTLGLRPEEPVTVCLPRSAELVIALLGVLKAGGVYVPLDPDQPAERVAFLLQDSGSRILLTRSDIQARLPATGATIVLWERIAEKISGGNVPCPNRRDNPRQLAYILYTSGSTGRPKGALVEHRGVVNFTRAFSRGLRITRDDRVLHCFSPSSDGSLSDIFSALANGACLIVADRETVLTPGALESLVLGERVTVATLTPSMMTLLRPENLPELRTVCSVGEPISGALAARWAPGRLLINGYGLTETSIGASLAELTGPAARATIGRPLDNVQLYVLDANLSPTPIGAVGEICIGGVQVGRGYLNRPDLTDARFVPDPFCPRQDGRLYRTGDLGRLRADGGIELLGRSDDQVKIRGYRVEPGEIAAALEQHPEVAQAAVLVWNTPSSEPQLVAYLALSETASDAERPSVATADAKPSAAAGSEKLWMQNGLASRLRTHLRQRLPEHMIPSRFAVLDALPRTVQGKIDRQRLPEPPSRKSAAEGRRGPRDELEALVASVWQEVLGIRDVGCDDDFFALGGHSLLAVRVMAEIEARTGRRLPLSALFQEATVAHLADLLRDPDACRAENAIVPLCTSGSGRPFFCIHPAGGTVFCYRALAERLGGDRPFYGLQALGVDGASAPHTTIEAMVAHYIAAIRSVQPRGPYLIGGWSLGGNLAYETARQLSLQGEVIDLLALFDAGALYADRGPTEADFLPMIMALFPNESNLPLDELSRLAPHEQLQFFLQRAAQAEVVADDADFRAGRHVFEVFKTSMEAILEYRQKPYAGKITLFAAEHREDWFGSHADPQLGWGPWAQGGVETHRVPGSHLQMVLEPNVATLADKLRACLRCADALARR